MGVKRINLYIGNVVGCHDYIIIMFCPNKSLIESLFKLSNRRAALNRENSDRYR